MDFFSVEFGGGTPKIVQRPNAIECQRVTAVKGARENYLVFQRYTDAEILVTAYENKKMITVLIREDGFEQRCFKDLSRPSQTVSIAQFIEAVASLTKAS
jgi:hypothetical protein